MKKSLATLLVLLALCAPTLAGVMTTGPGDEEPPPDTTLAAYVVPAIVVILLP